MVGSKRDFFKIIINIFRVVYLLFNSIVILAILAIHFIFKEHSYRSSLFYYAFPLPIILLIVLFLSIFLFRKFRRYNFLVAALLLFIWLGRSFKIHFSETINENDIEIVFWNASRHNGYNQAFQINNSIPDILVMVESARSNIENFKNKYPNFYLYLSKKEIAIFSKTPIRIIKESSSKYNSKAINFEINNINFYAIDIQASHDVPRKRELKFIDELIVIKENTIILGDFNTPYESKYLNNIKTNFNHAFNEKGNGFRETWFWNIPLLSLDHIWVSKDLSINHIEKINTFKSDHSMLRMILND